MLNELDAAGSLEVGKPPETIAELWALIDGRFRGLEARLGRVERMVEGLKGAVLVLARNMPGPVPGVESHVEREVREALETSGDRWIGASSGPSGSLRRS